MLLRHSKIHRARIFGTLVIIVYMSSSALFATEHTKRISPEEHPRLLGSRAYLQSLAANRPDAYTRVVRVAREQKADDHAKMISMAEAIIHPAKMQYPWTMAMVGFGRFRQRKVFSRVI